jgi:hypothetical protein
VMAAAIAPIAHGFLCIRPPSCLSKRPGSGPMQI